MASGATAEEATARDPWDRVMPVLFVALWPTGFIGARYAMPWADPMTFLALRFALAGAILWLLAAWLVPHWRLTWARIGHLTVAGLLIQMVYLGGVFVAVSLGLEAGTSALIVGIQPVLTTALAGLLLGERVRSIQVLGLLLGMAGVSLVVANKLGAGLGTPVAVAFNVASLIAIAIGSIYQKRYCSGIPLLPGTMVQFIAAGLACAAAAYVFEPMRLDWTGELIFALVWLTGVLSIGAVALLHIMIERGAAANVASLFFLVPPIAAAMAWGLFGEEMGPTAMGGMALAAIGVWLVNRPAR